MVSLLPNMDGGCCVKVSPMKLVFGTPPTWQKNAVLLCCDFVLLHNDVCIPELLPGKGLLVSQAFFPNC